MRDVLTVGLNFIIPRLLKPHSAKELCLWGVSGLSALDPAISFGRATILRLSTEPPFTSASESMDRDKQTEKPNIQLILLYNRKILLKREMPKSHDVKAWVDLTLAMMQMAWRHSEVLQSLDSYHDEPVETDNGQDPALHDPTQNASANMSGSRDDTAESLITCFFDEIFNHLDPYSRYLSARDAHEERNHRQGETYSIGLTLEHKDGQYPVISAINVSSPAWDQGVNIGQTILEIDGKKTLHVPFHTILHWLYGPADSQVTLKLGTAPGRTQDIVLKRQALPPETVFPEQIGPYTALKITHFSTQTAEEASQYLASAMPPVPHEERLGDKSDSDTPPFETISAQHLPGVILDLRGNRGGVLQQAVITAALFLNNGIAATTEGRNPASNHIWAVQGGDITNGSPLIILVDGQTASAAEVLAAALADRQRAVVIGSSTLGKGLVQIIGQMPNGGEIFVTWSRNIAPLGWPIQGLGVMPQLCTSQGSNSVTAQIRALRRGYSLQSSFLRQSRMTRDPASIDQILDIRQHCPAAMGTDLDIRAARQILESPDAYETALHSVPDDLNALSSALH